MCDVVCCAGLKGLTSGALSAAVTDVAITQGLCRVQEAVGSAGDLLLLHPLLLHARSTNLGKLLTHADSDVCQHKYLMFFE